MKITPKIEKAIKKASILHYGQKRKGEIDYPYITHPFTVAAILSNYTDDEEIIIAGLLHDTIEDTSYTPEKLEEDFGANVKEIVLGVTEVYTDENKENEWVERKKRYIENMKQSSDKAVLVSAADKLHNLSTIVFDFKKHGPVIWKNFNSTIEERLWFYNEILMVFKNRLPAGIVNEFEAVYNEALKLFSNK